MRTLLIAAAVLATLAAQTPTPRKIAVSRTFGNAGQLGLFIAASDGSDERLLLSAPDTDYDPVWAPDGSSIVFTSERDGSADLYRVNPDGSALERLTSDPAYDDQAAFSPDAKQLVFVSSRRGGKSALWIIDLTTRRVKPLTSGSGGDFRPSWSPDGKSIAFASNRGNAAPFSHGRWERLQLMDIYIIHPDGSGLKRITETGNFCGSPKWMADSRHVVAYCMTAEQTLANRIANPDPGNDTRLVSIDAITGASTDLDAGPGVKMNPSPLPGNDIGYVRKDQAGTGAGIYYMSGKRGPRGDVRAASWSPDGKHVVFHKRLAVSLPALRKTFSRNPNYELSLTGTYLPAFSPSGDRFVTNSRPSPNVFGASLFVTTTATGRAEVVHQEKNRNVLAAEWFPRGDKIIFSIGAFGAFFNAFHEVFVKPGDRVEGGAQIAIVNPDGTGFEELTTGAGNNAFPSLAPDGKRFVFRTFEADRYGLRIMNLATKAVATLTTEYDNFPLWSPRGDLIMFSRLIDNAYEIYTIKPDGTSLKRLTLTHGNDAHMAWSPDGEYIAFASSRMGFKDEVLYTDAPQPYGELFVMRYDGTRIEQLTDNQWEDGTPAWQPTAAGKATARKSESTTLTPTAPKPPIDCGTVGHARRVTSTVSRGVAVQLEHVRRVFNNTHVVIADMDLSIDTGEFLAVLGPSGCGKSTLLRMIARLAEPDSGRIRMEPDGERFQTAFVFQDAHLLPWRNVLDNAALPLELMGVAKPKRDEMARATLERVGLLDALDRYPAQLSGGMRMRASLARALVTEPRLLLLDEPFAALDEITRFHLDVQLRQLWQTNGMTVIFVTHSVSEAAFLANRAVVLARRGGAIRMDRTLDLPAVRDNALRGDPRLGQEMRRLLEAIEE